MKKFKINEVIAKTVLMVSKGQANSSCPAFLYQPKLPEAVKKLRKF